MDEARTLGLWGQRRGRTPNLLGLLSRCLRRCRTFRNLRRLRNLRALRNLRKVHGDERSSPPISTSSATSRTRLTSILSMLTPVSLANVYA